MMLTAERSAVQRRGASPVRCNGLLASFPGLLGMVFEGAEPEPLACTQACGRLPSRPPTTAAGYPSWTRRTSIREETATTTRSSAFRWWNPEPLRRYDRKLTGGDRQLLDGVGWD